MNGFDFIYARELKNLFTVYGSYYDIELKNGDKASCRNILEIYRKDNFDPAEDFKKPFFSKPDALFIMMNPGSSEPRENGYKEPLFKLKNLEKDILENRMVFAKPDVTQYQVMRVMFEMDWKHVRVLNLSDIRESKSAGFFKKVKNFSKSYGDVHTIFSHSRKSEREKALKLKNSDSPVILGWGRDRNLKEQAWNVLSYLKGFNIKGIRSDSDQNLYLHPSPNIQTAKELWLQKIFADLKDTS